VRALRERVEVERKGKVLQHPVAKRLELIARGLGAQPFDELRLSSLTLWRRDEDPPVMVDPDGRTAQTTARPASP
jgi:hypothetical protein